MSLAEEAQAVADEVRMQAAMARAYARAGVQPLEVWGSPSGAVVALVPFVEVTDEDII